MAKPCKHCGSDKHASTFCWLAPRKRITKQGKEYHKWQDIRKLWFKENPPGPDGRYNCYLRISPDCIPRPLASMTTLDHIKPRSRQGYDKHDFSNLRPACFYCNTLKGSRSLESLSIEFPHLQSIIKELKGEPIS